MSEFINSGRVLSLALAIVMLEISALLALGALRNHNRPRAAPDVLANLCAAAGLLGAAELLLAHAPWPYAASALGAALIAHVLALRLRWRTTQPARTPLQ
jgi:redox-regulated HSP33 family molecular chaperone